MGDKDITEKQLEAYNDVFADIVNGLMFRGEQVVNENALTDAQPFSMYKADGNLHEQERDVAKYCEREEDSSVRVRLAFFGMENQTDYEKDMPIRIIGYDGAAYRAELSQENRYPVISMVLYFGDDPWGKNRTLYDAIDVPEYFRPYVSDYRINVFDIPRLPEEAIEYFHSDFQIVVDYFVHKRNDPDYRPRDHRKFKHVDELLKLMAALTKDHRFLEILNEKGEKPEDMCEVLDRAEERGRMEGLKEGRIAGLEEGRTAGLKEGRSAGMEDALLESIKNVMFSLSLPAEKAMDVLRIPAGERKKYMERL